MTQPDQPTCQNLLMSLNEYIDGELDPVLCAQLEAHFASCDNCQVVFNTLQKTIQICQRDCETITLPDDVRSRVMAKLGLETDDDP